MKKQFFVLSTLAASLVLAACNPQNNHSAASSPAAASSATASASSAPAAASAPAGLESESKQLGYLLGYDFAMQAQLNLMKKAGVEFDKDAFMQAVSEQMDGKPTRLSPQQAQAVVAAITQKMQAAAAKQASETAAAGEKFLADNKTKEGVKTTASGLQYQVKKEGTGAQVALGDLVNIVYEGRLTDGTVFDSTKQHGSESDPFPLIEGSVIPGFSEGLQLMKEGGEYTLYIPAKLGYGERGNAKIPANSVLVFDVKIAKVEKGGAKKAAQAQQAAQQAAMQQAAQQATQQQAGAQAASAAKK